MSKILAERYRYRKNDQDDMATHIAKVEAENLASVNEKQSENSVMCQLLYTLPESYDSLKDAWDSVYPELQTRENLVSRLLNLNESAQSQDKVSEVALVAKDSRDYKRVIRKKDKTKLKCYNCGKPGHFSRDCRYKMLRYVAN